MNLVVYEIRLLLFLSLGCFLDSVSLLRILFSLVFVCCYNDAAIMSLCSMENVPMVSSKIEQHNEVKSGHILRLELQDMLNSHGMMISQFQADSNVSIEKHSNV